MGLFGKTDDLAALLKKVEAETSPEAGDLPAALEVISVHPEFQLERQAWMFSHENRKVREFAAAQVRAKKSPAIIERVFREIVGKPTNVRQELARLAVECAPDRIQGRLGNMVHSGSGPEKEAALDLIEAHPKWQEFLAYLKATLHDREPRIRQRTARILANGLENCTIFMILRELINDEDEILRHIVIEAFSRKPTGEIVEPFFERLTFESPELRLIMTKALSQLARHHQAQIEERILPMLGDESSVVRDIAVKLMSEMPDRTRVLRAFLIHCRTIACWLRERSIESLSKIRDSLLDPLIDLMQEGDDDLRVNAMLLASGSRNPKLLPLVKEIFLSQSDWWIRSLAADLLGHYPEEQVTDTLTSKLEDPDLKYSIIAVLGKQGTPRAFAALFECLEDPQRGVRIAVLNAIKDAKTPLVADVIGSAARTDADPGVREKAFEILQGFGDLSRGVIEELEARHFQELKVKQSAPLELAMANESLNP